MGIFLEWEFGGRSGVKGREEGFDRWKLFDRREEGLRIWWGDKRVVEQVGGGAEVVLVIRSDNGWGNKDGVRC